MLIEVYPVKLNKQIKNNFAIFITAFSPSCKTYYKQLPQNYLKMVPSTSITIYERNKAQL